MLVVKIPFVGHGYNMPRIGELIDPPPDIRAHLLSIGVVDRYETKVDPLPAEVKKKTTPSASLPAGRAPRKKTRKRSKKSALKS